MRILLLSAFIVVIMATAISSLSFLNDPEIVDNVDRVTRVKRQWNNWNMYSYKSKTPFYKMKIKIPFPYGASMCPFDEFGYPGHFGYPPLHAPYLFGGYHYWV
ncbi:hypothetical protein WUBG_01367 [Wuchereria bancrofti]|uniref:Uncharacterized protein n=2 Tax=Wuchereria bancrofti TaxID=6293 RepID=J9EZP0_WUCBA|nr:hypothetical protein WUBG_01367 [Wuchereria bancrofti]VDM20988.1 unnamed protein product [Wuchereria bancrofti]